MQQTTGFGSHDVEAIVSQQGNGQYSYGVVIRTKDGAVLVDRRPAIGYVGSEPLALENAWEWARVWLAENASSKS